MTSQEIAQIITTLAGPIIFGTVLFARIMKFVGKRAIEQEIKKGLRMNIFKQNLKVQADRENLPKLLNTPREEVMSGKLIVNTPNGPLMVGGNEPDVRTISLNGIQVIIEPESRKGEVVGTTQGYSYPNTAESDKLRDNPEIQRLIRMVDLKRLYSDMEYNQRVSNVMNEAMQDPKFSIENYVARMARAEYTEAQLQAKKQGYLDYNYNAEMQSVIDRALEPTPEATQAMENMGISNQQEANRAYTRSRELKEPSKNQDVLLKTISTPRLVSGYSFRGLGIGNRYTYKDDKSTVVYISALGMNLDTLEDYVSYTSETNGLTLMSSAEVFIANFSLLQEMNMVLRPVERIETTLSGRQIKVTELE